MMLTRLFHSGSGWADLLPRLISGIILLAVSFSVIWYGGWIYNFFVLLISLIIAFEGLSLARGSAEKPFQGIGHWSAQIAALAVAVIGGLGFFFLRTSPFGAQTVFFLLLVVASCDTGAYFSGRLIGGRKLAPSISPGKTISGALGGLAAGIIVALILVRLFTGSWLFSVIFYAFFLGVSSQIGDLCESAAKRRAGVKDSGKIIPGHGGALDRFDGMLGAIPLAMLLQAAAGEKPFWALDLRHILHFDL